MKIAKNTFQLIFAISSVLFIGCAEKPKSKAAARPADTCATDWPTTTTNPAGTAPYTPPVNNPAPAAPGTAPVNQPGQFGFNLLAAKNYVDDAKSIFDEFCVSCHMAGGTGAASGLLDTYAGVKAFDKAVLEKSVMDPAAPSPMPPLTATALDNIKKSILQDFFAGGLIEEKILNYKDDISVALTKDCISCHDGTDPKLPNLTTFENAKTEGSNLALSLQDSGIHVGLDLPTAYIALFEEWETLGFPEGKDSPPPVNEEEVTEGPTGEKADPSTNTTQVPVATQQPFNSQNPDDCYLPTNSTPITPAPNPYQEPNQNPPATAPSNPPVGTKQTF